MAEARTEPFTLIRGEDIDKSQIKLKGVEKVVAAIKSSGGTP